MHRENRQILALALTLLVSASCYVGGSRAVDPARLNREPGWLRAENVSFIPQRAEDDCGAAALAMVLSANHVPQGRDEIIRLVPPREGGIRAGDLRDVARRAGLASYVVSGRREDLETQLSRGRPVLVGLAKPLINGRANLHYEVVAGLHAESREVLTLDPAIGWRAFSWQDFAREWATTGAVTVLVFPREWALETTSARAR